MDYEKALVEIEKTLDEIKKENKKTPIIVEGKKDIRSLRKLGVKGKIIRLNQGVSLSDLCDKVSIKYDELIILTDWDKKGGILCMRLKKNLAGRAKCLTSFRKILAKHSTTKTIEGLPSWIQTFKKRLNS